MFMSIILALSLFLALYLNLAVYLKMLYCLDYGSFVLMHHI